MRWTKDEIKEMTAVLLRRVHGDGRDRQEVETVCLLAETSIMNRESCEDLMEKIAALEARLAGQWRPIESAPKDGSQIQIGWWMEQPKRFIQRVGFWTTDSNRTGWFSGEVGSWGYEEMLQHQPTLWMPLPPPPVKE